MFLQAKRTARMIVGAIRQQPNRPKYNARLNDPLEVGRCPTLPELPEGGVRREDGWIAPSVQPRFPRLLKRQYGSWITQHFTSLPTRLLTWLLKRQLKTIAEQYLARLSFLSWADIVFCDGDGAFADQWDWSRNHVIKVLAEWLAAKRLGANVFIVNQTVALNTPWLKTLAAYVYNEMDGIVVREPLSRKELIDMGVRPEIIFLGADAATWADYKEGLAWQDKGLKIIPDDIAGGLGLFIRGDMGEDVQVWADLVRNMHQLYGRPIVFVPSSKSEDSDFAHAIAQNSPLVVLDEVKHFDQAFSVLQHLSIVISSRYHPVYFSILAGVPFIAIRGNTFKTRGLQQLIEYPLTVIEESSDFQSQIMRHVQTILENYNEFQQLILARREKLRQLAVLNARVAEETSVYSFWINQLRLKRKRSGQN